MVNTLFRDASLRQQIERLTRDMEADTRRAFLASIEDIRSNVALTRLRDALKAGDIAAALDALNVEPAAYRALQAALVDAYTAAGLWQIQALPSQLPNIGKVVVRWDMNNPRAQAWLEELSGVRITNISTDQLQAARRVIESGFQRGDGPNKIALDIVGRIGPNGKRTGGVLGLNEPQANAVNNYRDALDNDLSRAKARKLTAQDRRIIQRAIDTDTPLTAKQKQALIGRYENRLLRLRGETIARTETQSAVNLARLDSAQQYIDKTGLPPSAVSKTWHWAGAAPSGHARVTHSLVNGTTVNGLNTPFNVGGTLMQSPHDPAGGAENNINCRCSYSISINRSGLAV